MSRRAEGRRHESAWGAARGAAWGAPRGAAWGAARGTALDVVWALGVVWALAALGIGCGGAPPPSTTATRAEPDARTILPNGASLFVLARPRELYDADASATILRTLFSDAHLDGVRVQYGIDGRALERLAFARYEDGAAAGDVLVIQGPFRAEVAVAEIAHRMMPRESETRGAGGEARAAGVLHGTRMDVLSVGLHTLVVVNGPPSLTERVTRTIEGTVPPLVAGPIEQAVGRHAEPFVAMRPIPLGLDGSSGASLLLSEEETLLVAVSPAGASTIHVSVDLTGGFPPTAEQNFRQLASSLAQSPMGTALGLRSALATLEVQASPESVRLAATLRADEVAQGLHLVFGAEIAEALGDPPSTTTN